jgi:predicted nucleotidyltransferase
MMEQITGTNAMPDPSDDPILQRFKAALREIYGNRIERVVLFGSRARGAARDDSDYDIAVFFRDLPDIWRERLRLADLRVDFLDTTGAFFDAKPYATAAFRDRTPLMSEIRRDGVDV